MNVERVILKHIRNRKVYLLCSSGIDSVAITDYVLSERMVNVSGIIHFNHNLREQNNEMESAVKRFVSELYTDIPLTVYKNNEHLVTEDDFRKFRINHLMSYDDSVFFTAHHLDDCVESYLLNCFRGNPEYLPIPFKTDLNGINSSILKPFIFNKKIDFIEWVNRQDLMKYVVEDETNKIKKGSRRNLIRNEILPILDREKMGLQKVVLKKMKQKLQNESQYGDNNGR